MSVEVAPDGSPVAVYLALPPGDAPAIIDSETVSGGSILELGSGPGRITRPLAEMGHAVVAVDNSPEMLAHIDCAETVLVDLFTLDLARTFDGVVAGSHLINAPDPLTRQALLAVCRRHVAPGGVVLIERYEPAWAAQPTASQSLVGPVHIRFDLVESAAGAFRGRVTYRLDGRVWTQEFTAANVTAHMLGEEAKAAGLRLSRWLDPARTWARFEATEAP